MVWRVPGRTAPLPSPGMRVGGFVFRVSRCDGLSCAGHGRRLQYFRERSREASPAVKPLISLRVLRARPHHGPRRQRSRCREVRWPDACSSALRRRARPQWLMPGAEMSERPGSNDQQAGRSNFAASISCLWAGIAGSYRGMVVPGDDRAPGRVCAGPLYVGKAWRSRGTRGLPGSFTFSPRGGGFIYLGGDVFDRVCSRPPGMPAPYLLTPIPSASPNTLFPNPGRNRLSFLVSAPGLLRCHALRGWCGVPVQRVP